MSRSVWKSTLSVILSVVMVATLTPGLAYAQQDNSADQESAYEPTVQADADEAVAQADANQSAAQAVASNSWYSQAETGWLTSPGTYQVSTASQLASIAVKLSEGESLSGYTFILINDINLDQFNASGEPLVWETTTRCSFAGVIDGQGFGIYGMNAIAGRACLFGKAENAAFYNLEISGTLASDVAAAFAGSAINSTFQDCINAATITGKSATGLVGGLVGYAQRCSFFGCQNAGRITGPARAAGGIVGEAVGCEFEACFNEQSIQGSLRSGGIIGTMALSAGVSGRTTLWQCANQAAVAAEEFAGGLIGVALAQTTLGQSYNYGSVEGGSYTYNGAAYAGGIAGYVAKSESTIMVEDCFNAGSAWAVASGSASHAFAGGIFGGSGSRFTIERTYNTGNAHATQAQRCADGAFVGYVSRSFQSSERDCYWLEGVANRANGTSVITVPTAQVIAPSELRTIVARLGYAFAYSAYQNGAPELCWTTNTAELRYLPANGTAVLARVAIQAGATVSGADIAKLYSGEDPVRYEDGRALRFLGWSTSATGQAGASIGSASGVIYVYPVFEQPAPVVKPTGEWVASDGRWWFRHNNGSYTRSAWEYINGAWYHFDGDGWMQTGWLKLGSTWYYLKPSGAMAEGWQLVSGVWYYLTPSDGAMRTGWLHLGNTWYYLRSSGAMATGWQKVGTEWYYLNTNGAMAEGWKRVNGTWYYLQPTDGAMKTGWLLLGGTWYYLRSSGAMVTGWQKIGGIWYYFNGSGELREELIEG
ncbi:N-acetylmuramoyl-L-alanine amidase family protein [Eggerthellaceae bacterium 3-80]